MTRPDPERLAHLAREIALACDRDGRIAWCDERAAALLGAVEGRPLASIVDCAADRVASLLDRGRRGRADEGALPLLLAAGERVPFAVSAAPADGAGEDVLLVARRLDDADAREREHFARLLRERDDALAQLDRELEESNRGVIALYSELDEKADSLRRTSEVKSRVVSNVSHEFRTPLNSILGLARLLLTRADGPLSAEQEKVVGFILRSATELAALVDDLLDLSRMEAGKVRLHSTRFSATALFQALRGVSRPLQLRDTVQLVFDPVDDLPMLETDDGKISQILRNLVSNALKFTARGEVRVSARLDGDHVRFSVADTGVGIPPADRERVFEEFIQLENALQREVKGTGLGLSLSRKLAELLGGTLTVESTLGVGSTFTLSVPRVHPEVEEMSELEVRAQVIEPGRSPLLVLEDDRQTLFLYERYLAGSGFQVVPARSVDDARQLLTRLKPAAIVLDIMLEGETSWQFLSDLKSRPETRDIPVLVVTVTDREHKARALGADEFWMKPMDQEWLLKKLQALGRRGPLERVLVIDDDDVSRYLVRRLLADTSYRVIEASTGPEGIKRAREEVPQVILLDFVMPGMSAFEVLDELKADPRTRGIPVIIHTSKTLDPDERERLARETAAILSKQSLSREVAIGRIRDVLMQTTTTTTTTTGTATPPGPQGGKTP